MFNWREAIVYTVEERLKNACTTCAKIVSMVINKEQIIIATSSVHDAAVACKKSCILVIRD